MLSSSGSSANEDKSQYFNGDSNPKMSVLFNQRTLNDLVHDFDLPKISAKLLASRLSEHKMLTQDTKMSFYRDREKSFLKYFSTENNFVFCHDVKGLLNALGCEYITYKYRMETVYR